MTRSLERFCPRLLIVPCVDLQPALDENGSPFFRYSPATSAVRPQSVTSTNVTSSRFSPAVGGVSAIYRNSKIAHRAAFGGVTHFRIACEISEQKNFVELAMRRF